MSVKISESENINAIQFKDQASNPATPNTGFQRVFTKADGLYVIDDAGAVTGPLGIGGGSYTDEQAQDAVGTILVDGTTINFTYNDATPSITAEVQNLTAANISDFAEAAQDAVGGVLSDAGDIDFTYDDATPAITGAVKSDSVTYAKMQNVSAAEKLLGRGAGGGSGDVQEITLGTNLTMSGTTLNAGGTAVDSDAIHDNVTGEIAALTEKTTLHNDDLFLIEDSEASNAKKKVKKSNVGGGGGAAYGQTIEYPTSFTGDVINGSSTTPFVDVAAFDTKEILNSRILHLVTLGASKDQRVRVTLGTPKAAAFDVRVCLAVSAIPWSSNSGDYYTEVRLSTGGDAQIAIARIIPVYIPTSTPFQHSQAIRVGGSALASVDANIEPKARMADTVTLQITRDGSNNLAFYFGFGTAPMALARILDGGLVPYAPTASGTLARIEIAQHSPSGPGSTAQIETFVDYAASV